jgi:hypothetical protein
MGDYGVESIAEGVGTTRGRLSRVVRSRWGTVVGVCARGRHHHYCPELQGAGKANGNLIYDYHRDETSFAMCLSLGQRPSAILAVFWCYIRRCIFPLFVCMQFLLLLIAVISHC